MIFVLLINHSPLITAGTTPARYNRTVAALLLIVRVSLIKKTFLKTFTNSHGDRTAFMCAGAAEAVYGDLNDSYDEPMWHD